MDIEVPITPEERAEQILASVAIDRSDPWFEKYLMYIAFKIREAQEEVANQLRKHWFSQTETDWGKGIKDQGYREGRVSMREEAARVVESKENEDVFDRKLLDCSDQYSLPRERDFIANCIRTIAVEGK